jgi:hypothetical protein
MKRMNDQSGEKRSGDQQGGRLPAEVKTKLQRELALFPGMEALLDRQTTLDRFGELPSPDSDDDFLSPSSAAYPSLTDAWLVMYRHDG